MSIAFDQNPPAASGTLAEIAPDIRRIIAGNAGPFTFTGTCTYIVGHGSVAVIDPGPDDPDHADRILAALGHERIAGILVTHTHRDHSPGARLLAARIREAGQESVPILGCAPHAASRPARPGEEARLDASADSDHLPDRTLADGETIELAGQTFRAIATPGHTANHLAFSLEGTGMVFSGDHVMAWSTTIVAPPDGAMGAYLASLEKLIAREDDRAYWPGHGGPVLEPRRFTRALLQHRRQRETQIMDLLARGTHSIPALVAVNYPNLKPALIGAACLSTLAHLEDLVTRGLVRCEGAPSLGGLYTRA